MKILVTGSAGFIGFHLCNHLCKNKKINLIGIDNLNNYYDVRLKKNRLKILKNNHKNFNFLKLDIENQSKIKDLFRLHKFKIVIHLAAQAGVRYSIAEPRKYLNANIVGFFNIIEQAKNSKVKHFLFASTSSVYGNSTNFPLDENENTDKPLSFYAATKKSNEVMAYSYSNIYKLPSTALRFFTVYGPYGRPDMALNIFTDSFIKNKQIKLHNKGNHIRDFTYVEDIVFLISQLINKPPSGKIPFEIYNLASSNPKKLTVFLDIILKNLNIKKIRIKNLKMQIGDVFKTHANTEKISKKINYKSKINIEVGIKRFIEWYKSYYK